MTVSHADDTLGGPMTGPVLWMAMRAIDRVAPRNEDQWNLNPTDEMRRDVEVAELILNANKGVYAWGDDRIAAAIARARRYHAVTSPRYQAKIEGLIAAAQQQAKDNPTM
jgi:hypothetical protein